jgi:hypothetical protein
MWKGFNKIVPQEKHPGSNTMSMYPALSECLPHWHLRYHCWEGVCSLVVEHLSSMPVALRSSPSNDKKKKKKKES